MTSNFNFSSFDVTIIPNERKLTENRYFQLIFEPRKVVTSKLEKLKLEVTLWFVEHKLGIGIATYFTASTLRNESNGDICIVMT